MGLSQRICWRAFVLSAFVLLASSNAWAIQRTWNGSVNSSWATPGNWSGSVAPVNGDSVVLTGAGTAPTNQNIAGLTLISITIDNTVTVPYTITGSPVTITTAAGISVNTAGAANVTLGINLALGIAQTWTIGASRTLTVSGVISGAFVLTKAGAGTLALSVANSYSGTTIADGKVQALAADVLLPAGALTVNTPGIFDLNGFNQTVGAFSGSGTVTLGGTAGTLFTFGTATNTTFSGAISGTGGIAKSGTGTFTLQSVLTYNGPTNVNGGVFKIAVALPDAFYTFDNMGSASLVNNDGNFGATNNATIFSPASRSTGNGGRPGRGECLLIPHASGTTGYLQITSALSLAGGNWTVIAWVSNMQTTQNYRTLYRGQANDHQLIIEPNQNSLGIFDNAGGTNFNVATPTVSVAGFAANSWHMIAVVGATGAPNTTTIYLDNTAVGSISRRSTTNIYSVGNYWGGGQPFADKIDDVMFFQRALSAGEIASVFTTGSASPAVNFLPVTTGLSISAGATMDFGPASQTVVSAAGAAGSTLTINSSFTITGAGDATYAGNIGGTGSLIKSGAGTLTLSGTNTYSGTTTINAGTFKGAAANTLPTNSTVILNAGTLDLNGFSQTIGSLSGAAGTSVTLGANAATVFTLGGNNNSTTFAGVISGSGNLNKAGSGTFSVSAVQTYSGSTNVSGGTLDFGNVTQTFTALSGAIGATILTQASLTLNDGGLDNTFLGNFGGTGGFTKNGAGTLTLGGKSTHSGPTTINGGRVRLQGSWAGEAAAYYSFDLPAGTTTIPNLGTAGASKNATLSGATAAITTGSGGKSGEGLSIVNNSDVMLISPTSPRGIDLSGGNWTAAVWFNTLFSTANFRTLYRGSVNDHQVIIRQSNDDLGCFDNGGGDVFVDSGADLPVAISGWHHLVAVGSGTTTAMYLDGVLIGTCNRKSSTDIYGVGNYWGGGQPFAKKLDDLYIFQRVLTPAEILDLYNNVPGTKGTNVLSPFSALTLNNSVILDVAGITQTIGSLTGSATSNIILAGGSLTSGANNSSTTFAGTITGAGGFGKDGTGTLTITNSLTNAGTVSVLGGTLRVPAAFSISPTSAVTIGSAGILDSTNFSQTFGSLAGGNGGKLLMGTGASTVLTVGGDGSNTTFGGTISGNCDFIKNGGGIMTLSGAQTFTGNTTVNAGTLKLAAPIGPVVYYSFENVAGATVNNDGTLGSTRNGTLFSGAAIVAGGASGAGNALSIPADTSFMGIATSGGRGIDLNGTDYTAAAWFNTLKPITRFRTLFRGNINDHQVIIRQNTHDLGMFDNAVTGTFIDSGYDLNSSITGWHHIAVVGSGTSSTFYIDGVLVGTSAKKSVGDIYSVGNYWGPSDPQPFADKLDDVYIFTRALSPGEIGGLMTFAPPIASEVLPSTTNLTLNGVAILDMTAGTQTLPQFTGSGTSSLILTGGKLILGGAGNTFTYSGNITGSAGVLVKDGAGTMTLTGNNTYTGGTQVLAGTLQGNSNSLSGDIANSGTVVFDQGGTGTYAGVISGTGNVIKQNSGNLTISGTHTFTGTITITAGVLTLSPTVPVPAAYYSFDSVSGATVNNGGSLGAAKNGTLFLSATIAPGNKGNAMSIPDGSGVMKIALTSGKGVDLAGGSWTAMAWFKDLYPSAPEFRTLFRGNSLDHQIIVRQGNDDLGTFNNSSSVFVDSGYDLPAAISGWHHIAAIGSGTTTALYLDGALVGTCNYKSTSDIYAVGNFQGPNPQQPFAKFLDEVYIYQRALTPAELASVYAFSGGGSVTLSNVLPSTAQVIITGGALNLNNAAQTIGSLSGTAAGSVRLGTNGTGRLTTGNAASTTFAGAITENGGLVKGGTGTFTLTGASTFTGTTTVNAGTLAVANSTGSATGTGAVAIATGGTLSGTGIISGAVAVGNGATLSPGSPLGKMTIGALQVSTSGTVQFDLTTADNGAPNTGGDDEMLVNNGSLALGGILRVIGTGLQPGIYHLFSFTSTQSGNFASFNLPDGYAPTVVVSANSIDLALNHTPILVGIGNQTLNEAATLSFTASATDADAGQTLTYSMQGAVPPGATLGSSSGLFTWTPTDGPSQSQNLTIRVTDNGAFPLFAETTFSITVRNVSPSATVTNGGAVNEGSPGLVTFSGQIEPSSIDAAVLRYSYDFNSDGTFDLGGPAYASAVATASVPVPATFLSDNMIRTVRARIWDKDGGFSEYTTTFTVNNVAPTATLTNSGDVDEGTPSASVSFNNIVDPSTVDAASLHFAFDLDNNNIFDIGGNTYAASVVGSSATIPTAFLDNGPADVVVRARVYDKDGAFTEYFTTIHVRNVPPIAIFGAIPDAPEGGTTSFFMSSQLDPSVSDTNAGFHYSYDFNYDGVTPNFDLGGLSYLIASSNANPTIPANQILDGPATQTVLARIWDQSGGFTDYTRTFDISNAAPMLSNVSATAVFENSTTVLTGIITDAGVLDTFTVLVDWADGTIDQYDLTTAANGAQFSFSHVYLDDNPAGNYAVAVTVTDNDGDSDSVTVLALVSDANPVVTIPNGLAPHLLEHATTGLITLATFTDAGTLDTHTVTINWGDGTPLDTGATLIEPAGATPGQILANHLFDDGNAVRTVTVTVTDDDGGVGSATFNVIVDNIAPVATFRRPDFGSPEQMTSVEFVNVFDPSDADTAVGFLYSYDFDNDSIFEIAFSSTPSAAIPPQNLLSHPNHIVHGRITDKDGGVTDYYLQQPFFEAKEIRIEFDLGAQSSYTLNATGLPELTYTIEVVDLPSGVANLAALGLSFDGHTISGVPFVGGMLTLRATASSLAGIEVIDLIITINRPVNSNSPKIVSKAMANPNPAITNTPITFSVLAEDTDGDVLSYYWDFADGSFARGRVVTHTYTVAGKFQVTCSVSDGKHDGVFSQFDLVVAKGTDNTFDVQQAKIGFDFRKAEKSTLYFTGFIPVPSGSLAGVDATVSIAGSLYSQVFHLDAKGAGGDTMSLFSVKTIQTGSGTSRAKFVLSLKSTNGTDPLNPSLFQKLAPLDFTDGAVDRQGIVIPVPLVITIGAQGVATNTIPMLYKTAPHRNGKAQYKQK